MKTRNGFGTGLTASEKFWTFPVPLLLTVETRIEIAGNFLYVNVLSTCVTSGLTCVLRTIRDA